jgi:predicted transcriptional regulator
MSTKHDELEARLDRLETQLDSLSLIVMHESLEALTRDTRQLHEIERVLKALKQTQGQVTDSWKALNKLSDALIKVQEILIQHQLARKVEPPGPPEGPVN